MRTQEDNSQTLNCGRQFYTLISPEVVPRGLSITRLTKIILIFYQFPMYFPTQSFLCLITALPIYCFSLRCYVSPFEALITAFLPHVCLLHSFINCAFFFFLLICLSSVSRPQLQNLGEEEKAFSSPTIHILQMKTLTQPQLWSRSPRLQPYLLTPSQSPLPHSRAPLFTRSLDGKVISPCLRQL